MALFAEVLFQPCVEVVLREAADCVGDHLTFQPTERRDDSLAEVVALFPAEAVVLFPTEVAVERQVSALDDLQKH